MPRKRLRTTEKGNWTVAQLKTAIQLIDEGISIHHAAAQTRIPYSTLQKRYKAKSQDNIELKPARLGRMPVFLQEQEKDLAYYLITMSNMFYGLTSQQFRSIAYECAVKLNLKHDFDEEAKQAGPDWLQGFLKRNPTVSCRKPEAI